MAEVAASITSNFGNTSVTSVYAHSLDAMRRYSRKSSRKTYKKRRYARSRRTSRKSYRRSAHTYTRMTGIVNVALTANTAGQNSSGFITAGQFFQLSQVVNHGEFGALYDQYRVLRVKVFWRWTITSTLTTAAGTNRLLNPPVLMHDPDYDSAAAISHTSFLEHSRTRFRTLRPGAVVSYSFTPAALTTVVAPGNAYRPVFRPWLDMTNRDVQHYGLHTGYNYPGTEEYGTVQTWVKYTFQCKGQR